MDGFLTRYRNLSVLVIVLLVQLVLLAVQVKNNQDVRLIRVWAVTAITPLAQVLEALRANTIGVAGEYWQLWNVREENKQLKAQLDKFKLENHYLKEELETAKRVEAMAAFVKRSPSRTLGARIIGAGAGASSKLVFIDRGSTSGVMKGMPVITPDGIVGKVTASYPTGSMVMLITDPTFACGVLSQKTRIHATAKGQGNNQLLIDYIQNEQSVEVGEMFYTSGDDRIFPKGLPVGMVRVARPGKLFQEVYVSPAAFERGLEEVLVVMEGVHQQIPEFAAQQPNEPRAAPLPVPPAEPGQAPAADPSAAASASSNANIQTDADKLVQKYRSLGEQQGVVYGSGGRIPNFNPGAAPPKTVKPAAEKTAEKTAAEPAVPAPAPSAPAPSAPPASPAPENP